MTHPVIAQTAVTLAQLRKATLRGPVEESRHLSPNIYFCWDKAQGDAQITVDSVAGRLLAADITVSGTPEWFTLNIGLGFGGFQAGDAFGLALAASSSHRMDLHPFVRSVVGDARHDTHLTDPIRLGPSVENRIVLHQIQPQDAMSYAHDFHTLVIPLPRQPFRLDLQDMRAFHIPATGAALRAATLSALAV